MLRLRTVPVVLGVVLIAELVAFVPQYRVGNLGLFTQWAGGRSVARRQLVMGNSLIRGDGRELRLGETYGPWEMSDAAGVSCIVPARGRPTVVLAMGGCSSCSQQDLASALHLAGTYPEARWVFLSPQSAPWLSLYPTAAEKLTFIESPEMEWHRRLHAVFLPRAYVFDGNRRLLYAQPPEARLRPGALSSIEQILQALRESERFLSEEAVGDAQDASVEST